MYITSINNIYRNNNLLSKTIVPFASVSNKKQIFSEQNTNSEPTNSLLPSIYYQPLSFGKVKRQCSSENRKLAEKSGDFIVSKFCDIPCPACGKKMLNIQKFDMIYDELSQLEPEQYLDCLSKYTQYMRPVEESVFNEIYALSQEPGHTKDIRSLLVELRETKMPILQEAQMRLINKMRSLARTLPTDEKNVLQSKINSLKKIIFKHNTSSPFRRKIMIDRISKVKIKNQKKYEKLQLIAKSFPTSKDMNSAWIVKYSGKNKQNKDWESFDIALRFLSSSIANTDHILAYDIENNHDDISNYISMHNACNSLKGNKPFLQWLFEDKTNRIKYMTDYFKCVNELIQSEKIGKKKYRNYVAHATQTITDVSKGQVKFSDIQLELPDLEHDSMQ